MISFHHVCYLKFPRRLENDVWWHKERGKDVAGRVMSTGTSDHAGSLGLGRGLGRAGMSSYGIIKPSAELN